MDNIAIWIGIGFALANFLFVASFMFSSTMAGVAINKVSYGLVKFMAKKVKGISIEFGVLPISSSVNIAGVVDLDDNPNPEWKPTDYKGKSFITQLLIVLSSSVLMGVLGLLLSLSAGLSTTIIGIALKTLCLTMLFMEDVSTLIAFFDLYLVAATSPFLAIIGFVILVQGLFTLTNLQMVYNSRFKVSLSIVLLLFLMIITLGLFIRFILGGFILECLYVLLGALLAGFLPYLLILFLVTNLPIISDDFEDVIDSNLPMEE